MEDFRKLIAHFLITGYQPFTTVEDHGFRRLLQNIRPDLSIPSADTMTRFIKKEFGTMHLEVNRKFADISSKLSLTLDCWTSSSMRAFFDITVHWISDWTMHKCVLDFVDINDISHMGANLANVLQKVIVDSGIQRNILTIVTDNAQNNDTLFLNIQSMNIEHVRCFGHILNLIVQEALGYISESIIS